MTAQCVWAWKLCLNCAATESVTASRAAKRLRVGGTLHCSALLNSDPSGAIPSLTSHNALRAQESYLCSFRRCVVQILESCGKTQIRTERGFNSRNRAPIRSARLHTLQLLTLPRRQRDRDVVPTKPASAQVCVCVCVRNYVFWKQAIWQRDKRKHNYVTQCGL